MDKKRREKTSQNVVLNKTKKIDTLYAVSELVSSYERCGIQSKKFQFQKRYGIGYFQIHQFEGLSIMIFDVLFEKDLTLEGSIPKDFLEMSFLIEGEQIIKIHGVTKDLIYESQECYLLYLQTIQGSISYHKRKRLKEIKIRMSMEFIKRHRLDEEYNILENYSLLKLKDSFLKPLCTRTQDILTEILMDKRNGLLKRLFLESKVLELVSLKLEDTTKPSKTHHITSTDHIIKKLYGVQHMINSDLSKQYSIHELSRQIGLNDFILKKEFKQLFGKTIFEYTTKLRMDKARELLLHSKKPIYEISELVGYKNSTHFTAAFKKIEGMTPKKYRTKLSSEDNLD
ncbi:helix-turn-helix transcriptional regulator [Aquimarina litoralis]|uniref:helix-turn-helix transcriptional regulator n=1 Tax=Aquimarina litoralis TaxID=584605 RepID=UPI001FE24595|nr:AraC family transcriptional regulator [Aquimarina litoralis]